MQHDDQGPESESSDPLAALSDAVYRLDHQGRFTYLNAAAEKMLDRRADELLGKVALECFPDARGSVAEERYRAVLADGKPRQFRLFHEQRGRWYDVGVFAGPPGLAVFYRDIGGRDNAPEVDSEIRQLTGVLDALPQATVLVDGDCRILTANRAWISECRMIVREATGPGDMGDYLHTLGRGVEPRDREAIAAGLRRLLGDEAGEGEMVFDHRFSRRTGAGTGWYQLQASRLDGLPRLVVTHTDITDRIRDGQALAWQARHDELTGMPNRVAMLELIDTALAAVDGGSRTGVLVLDIDAFKTINDSLGHEVADAVLRQVGIRLLEEVRPGDAVGRLGGDQFVVLARDCDSAESAALAFRLQSLFGLPFTAGGVSVPLTASIGVATSESGASDAHQLLSDADAAMYAAKSSGRDRVHLFSPNLREAARWRLDVATRLRNDAIDQLVVHYQPVVRLDTGEIDGVEALVRWQHPERGLLSPDAFLSVAEETGLVIPITRWLLRETTRRAAQWAAEGLPLRMAVNISARHFAAETLVRDVRVALRESGLPPDQLVLELTETSVAEDPTRAEDQLAVLRSFGVRVAIDDFGTGWSSLAQLFSLPIGILKIDRSLLTAAEHAAGGETGAVLAAIVALTRTLGIRSVAEGVETPEHLRMIRAAGCDLAQGWLLGHPMPAEQLPGWVRRVHAAGGDVCALVEHGRVAG